MKKTFVFLLLVILFMASIPTKALAVTLYYIRLDKNVYGELKNPRKVTDLRFYGDGTETVDLMLAEPQPNKNYFFMGWQDAQSKEMLKDSVVTVTKQIKDYKAIFGANGYKITFDTQGGSAVNPVTGSFGDKIEIPASSQDGYIFGGWYPDEACTGDAISFPYTIKANATLYAKWIKELASYDVRFFNEGGAQIGETQKVDEDSYAIAPEDPAKDGHTFLGWNNGTQVLSKKDIEALKVTVSVDYTAVFKLNQYSVKFYDFDGTPLGSDTVGWSTAAIKPADPQREGHTFTGWSLSGEDPEKTDSLTNVQENLTATATYTINDYTVTFDSMGGSDVSSMTKNFGTQIVEVPIPTKHGHTFHGWFADEICTPENQAAFPYTIKENSTLFAKWTINTYDVTFYEQDGTTPIGTTQKVNWDSAAVFQTAPIIIGHTFDQWVLTGSDETEADSLTHVKENIKAVASYTKNAYTVTFVDDKGQVIGTDDVLYGDSAEAPNAPEREGYIFKGWDTAFDNVTDNITVTAQYAIHTYTVRFVNDNGDELSVQTVSWKGSATAPTAPTRTGYTFAGWDTAFDAVTEDIVVTAQYRPDPVDHTTSPNHDTQLEDSNVIPIIGDNTSENESNNTKTTNKTKGTHHAQKNIEADNENFSAQPGNSANKAESIYAVALADEPMPGNSVDTIVTLSDEDVPRSAPSVWLWLLISAFSIVTASWVIILVVNKSRGRINH